LNFNAQFPGNSRPELLIGDIEGRIFCNATLESLKIDRPPLIVMKPPSESG
jgi:hypothetical protein